MRKIHLITLALLTTLVYFSCEKDPEVPNEEELITTLTYTLTPVGGGVPVVFTYRDLDGDGGNAPVITGGSLMVNMQYNGVLTLLDETKTPVKDITEEVEEEGTEHQFFFQTTVGGLSVAYSDTDTEGKPIGLLSKLTTTTAGTGTLTITLKHKPNKAASGVSSGNIANAGGETDIEVTFNVTVQ